VITSIINICERNPTVTIELVEPMEKSAMQQQQQQKQKQ
jgi:hypothetical protein